MSPLPIQWETFCVPEPVWTLWRREQFFTVCQEVNLWSSSQQPCHYTDYTPYIQHVVYLLQYIPFMYGLSWMLCSHVQWLCIVWIQAASHKTQTRPRRMNSDFIQITGSNYTGVTRSRMYQPLPHIPRAVVTLPTPTHFPVFFSKSLEPFSKHECW